MLSKKSLPKKWCVYILQARGEVLYTGITNDLARRIRAHESGKGSKYLRGKAPLKLLYCQKQKCRSDALKKEYQIKQLSHLAKLVLCRSNKLSTSLKKV